MSAATSAQDRIERAKAALVRYSEETDPNGYDGTPDEVVDEMATIIEQLIEPARIAETPEQIADRILEKAGADRHSVVRGLIIAGIEAGIQAGWESWEPENAPGHDQSWEYGARYTDAPDSQHTQILGGATLQDAHDFALSRTRKSGATHIVGRLVTDWERIDPEPPPTVATAPSSQAGLASFRGGIR